MLKKVYLEISNVCNLACEFCPGTSRRKHFMNEDEFTDLVKKLRPYTEYLYFHLMGEPLLHPKLERFFEISAEYGFKVIITTNGTLLDKAGDILLNAPALHKVNISLQSFEANSGGRLESYLDCCAVFAGKASKQGKICVLRLWNKNGLDELNGNIEKYLESYFPKPWKESRKGKALADRVWLEAGDHFDWPELQREEIGDRVFCYGLRDQIGVLCDGTVVPCCLDRNGDIALGNLHEEELDVIMSTKRAEEIYNGFSRRIAVEELCRKCGYARRF